MVRFHAARVIWAVSRTWHSLFASTPYCSAGKYSARWRPRSHRAYSELAGLPTIRCVLAGWPSLVFLSSQRYNVYVEESPGSNAACSLVSMEQCGHTFPGFLRRIYSNGLSSLYSSVTIQGLQARGYYFVVVLYIERGSIYTPPGTACYGKHAVLRRLPGAHVDKTEDN